MRVEAAPEACDLAAVGGLRALAFFAEVDRWDYSPGLFVGLVRQPALDLDEFVTFGREILSPHKLSRAVIESGVLRRPAS